MIFSLDFRTFRQTLATMRFTGMVEASLPSGVFALGTVYLKVLKGNIQTCTVVTAEGLQITDTKRIEEQLIRVDLIEWNITSPATTPARKAISHPQAQLPPSLPSTLKETIPQLTLTAAELLQLSPTSYPRRLAIDPERTSAWPFAYRQVYNLSTGQNSEQHIGSLLRYKPADLLAILQDLERMGVLLRGI